MSKEEEPLTIEMIDDLLEAVQKDGGDPHVVYFNKEMIKGMFGSFKKPLSAIERIKKRWRDRNGRK